MGGSVLQNSNDATAASPALPLNSFLSSEAEPIHSVLATIFRVAHNGERYIPHAFRDGLFRVADPALGRVKHHSANQIAIKGEEIEAYLRRGFLLRMRGEISGQVNLIAASEITINR